ncbi:MAG: GH92 family glycosyl hydrolase [Caulobacteraceae bacterium]|nr:GH92 family glycosyl hydrolase [Caulobacter sp.]
MTRSPASFAVAAALALAPRSAAAAPGPSVLVDPLVGTANGGNTFPGAVVPFGMVQFSPEESPDPAKKTPIAAPGGYEHHLNRIRGFSLTNVSGWGCAGGSGDVPLMPVTVPVAGSPSADFRTRYAVTFDHAHEQARAGHYHVALDNGVGVDLAASTHAGVARFAFPAGAAANLLVRASDSEVGSEAAHVRVDPATRTVSADVTSGNFCGYIDKEDRRSYYTLHVVAVFDRPFASHGVWRDAQVTPGGRESSGGTGYGPKGFPEAGRGSGAWVGFDAHQGAVVTARIGVSYVSEANARANLAAESPAGTTLEAAAARAGAAWDQALGRIEVTGGEPEQRRVFYTALYHSLLHPNVFSDVNGEYAGMDGRAHRVEGAQKAQYANFSGWDVYRSQLQLVTWLDPQRGSDIAQSLFNQARQNGGAWDRWTHENGAVHVMNGDPAAPSLAGVWAFGGRGFDARGALASLVSAADHPTAADLSHAGCEVECAGERPGLDAWLKLHFIPTGAPAWGGAADTLEMSTAEFGVSALAARLGETATADRFLKRAHYWRNLFDPKAAPDGGYVRNRNPDGSWALVKPDDDDDGQAPAGPFTPATGDGFVEGSAAQYVWMVPFDVAGLFDAMGGVDRARRRLDGFFHTPDGRMAVTKAGPLHAELDNEPSIGAPWLYDYAGAPWKTQELVRRVLDTLWTDTPRGIPGNDDLGAMSAWAVWAMLGLYPETPGRAELVLGSPLFEKAVVHRAAGDVVITGAGAGPGRPYVRAVRLNDAPLARPWLGESFALTGGRLDFQLSDAPDRGWGARASDAPPSFGVAGSR